MKAIAISSVPNALVLFNPVVNTMEDGFGYNRFPPDSALMMPPVDNVGAHTPPTIIFVGTDDTTTPMANDVEFQEVMHDMGRVCDLHAYDGVGHGFFKNEPYRTETIELGWQFLQPYIIIKGCKDSLYQKYDPGTDEHVADSCRTLAVHRPLRNGFNILIDPIEGSVHIAAPGKFSVFLYGLSGNFPGKMEETGKGVFGFKDLNLNGIYILRIKSNQNNIMKGLPIIRSNK